MFFLYLAFLFLFLYLLKFNYKLKLVPFSDKKIKKLKSILKKNTYIPKLSVYDYQSKLQKLKDDYESNDYIKSCLENCLNWSEEELLILQKYHKKINQQFKKKQLNWIFKTIKNKKIYIVKNNNKHEGEIDGYTLQNFIFLTNLDYDVLIHQLFHIILKYNPHLQRKLYRLLEFKIADNLKLPNNIKDLTISNPDTSTIVYTTIHIQGHKFIVTPIVYTKQLKSEKTINESYLKDMNQSLLFVNLRNRDNQIILTPKNMEKFNLPNTMPISESKEYMKKLMINTMTILHPEEVLAINFVNMINNTTENKYKKIFEQILNIMRE